MFETRKLAAIAAVVLLAPAALQAARGESQPLNVGQVTNVDRSVGEITIKHERIRKFDMDGMTMVFRAKHPSMLKAVKPGDRIRFDVDKIDGHFTVTKIEKAR